MFKIAASSLRAGKKMSGVVLCGLAVGCMVSPDEALWKSRVDSVHDGTVEHTGDIVSVDVPIDTGVGPDLSDAGSVTCDDKYGQVAGYLLCEETATTCRFNANTGGGTCNQVCTQFGGTCLGAEDNVSGQLCQAVGTDTCDTPRSTEICICSK